MVVIYQTSKYLAVKLLSYE